MVDGAAGNGNSGEWNDENKPTLLSVFRPSSSPASVYQLPIQPGAPSTTTGLLPASVLSTAASSADDVGIGNVEAFFVARISDDSPNDYPHYDPDDFNFNDGSNDDPPDHDSNTDEGSEGDDIPTG